MFYDIQNGKYDGKLSACLGQTITISGSDGYNLCIAKDRPGWQNYISNMEELRKALQQILSAWEEYCVRNGKSNEQKVIITSGYRTQPVNGNSKSAHMVGYAVD